VLQVEHLLSESEPIPLHTEQLVWQISQRFVFRFFAYPVEQVLHVEEFEHESQLEGQLLNRLSEELK
jgi:hypothetical protein